jgi:hypothetical protein
MSFQVGSLLISKDKNIIDNGSITGTIISFSNSKFSKYYYVKMNNGNIERLTSREIREFYLQPSFYAS